MDDLVNIRIPLEADNIASRLINNCFFPTTASVCRFALAYAMRDWLDELKANYEELDDKYPSNGTNLNVGSIDKDNSIKSIILTILPTCSTPYRFARAAIIFGLYKINDLLMENNNDGLEALKHILR